MLILKASPQPLHLCTKHPEQNTAQSRATIAFDGEFFTIRDAVTSAHGDKQRIPRGNEFTVYVDADTEVHFSYYEDTNTMGITLPDNVQAMRHVLMKRAQFAPEWTR